jgi:hypothetical protein
MAEPFKFEDDIREALARGGADRLPASPKAQRRTRRLPFDPRPSSPAQLALVAIILLVLAYFRILGPFRELGMNLALVLLAVAAVTWMVRPRRRTVMWRERRIDLTPELSWIERLYYVIYRGK